MTDERSRRTWQLSFGSSADLDVKSDGGHIVLRAVETGEEPRLEMDGPHADQVAIKLRGGNGRVQVKLDFDAFGEGCDGHEDITCVFYVPRELRAHVRNDAGTIAAEGLGPCRLDLASDLGSLSVENVNGRIKLHSDVGSIEARGLGNSEVEIHTDVGSIDIEEARGRIQLATETGEIEGHGLAGTLEARTDYGSMRLQIDALAPGKHYLSTENGAIDVELPSDADIQVTTSVEHGAVDMRYPRYREAAAVLQISAKNGSIRVREARGGSGRSWPTPVMDGRRNASYGSRDAEIERVLKLVESGELSARDAHEILTALSPR